ncbi:MAG: elongation factor Ts, partial [Candidatus Peregrinibacteria bacterium GW2011_GWA2_44_7]
PTTKFTRKLLTPITSLDFFIKKTIPTNSNIGSLGDSLAQAFQPQRLLDTNTNKPAADIASLGEGSLRYIGGLFFGVIFTILGTITIFGIGAMLFVRYITLAILLVLVPLAYLSKVLPGLDDYTKKWWGHFFNWLLFGPAATFFLYITVITIIKKSQVVTNLTANSVPLNEILGRTGTTAQLGDMILSLGLMMASLIVAKQLGIYGSDTFLGAAKTFAEGYLSEGESYDPSKELGDLTLKMAEKIVVADHRTLEGEVVGSYVHSNQKIGAIVALQGGDEEMARDIAMHITAMKPMVLSPDEVDGAKVEKEREIWMDQLKKEGKPEAIVLKIMEGKEKKFREENALLKQPFVKNPDQTIEQLLNGVQIKGFMRLGN